MMAPIQHFEILAEGVKVPEGSAYGALESRRGEIGCHLVSDWSSKHLRMLRCEPNFVNPQFRLTLMRGSLIAVRVTIASSASPAIGEVDS